MRYIIAMFDAPFPAREAVRAVFEAGFRADDLFLMPELPEVEWTATHSFAGPWLEENADLGHLLGRLGVHPADVGTYVEGVRRGAIVVVVRAPTLSAQCAADALQSVAHPDLATHEARWAEDPDLVYGWSAVEPPIVGTPDSPTQQPDIDPQI